MKILRFSELKAKGIVPSRTALHRWTLECGFPQPTELGPNSVGWIEDDVLLWLDVRTLTTAEFDELGMIRGMAEDDFATFSKGRNPGASDQVLSLQIRALSNSKWRHLQRARLRPKAATEDGSCRGNRAGRATRAA
jgi:predicted DNA-binding transcriptional regulator AlpA